MLKADNRILEAKCNYYIKEMEIVGWYINVMEGGVDATQAMKNYAKVKLILKSRLVLDFGKNGHIGSHAHPSSKLKQLYGLS